MELDGVLPQTIEGPGPCDNCRWCTRCNSEQLACRDFNYFIAKGEPRTLDRSPTREQYIRAFISEEPVRLEKEDYQFIRQLYEYRGLTHKIIAEKYDVIPRRIKNIVEGLEKFSSSRQ